MEGMDGMNIITARIRSIPSVPIIAFLAVASETHGSLNRGSRVK